MKGVAPRSALPARYWSTFPTPAPSLKGLILDEVAPGSWAPEWGAAIRMAGDELVVTQTPLNQWRIGSLLRRLRKEQETCVSIRARLVWFPGEVDGAPVTDSWLEDAIARSIAHDGYARVIGTADLFCFDRQQNYTISGLLDPLQEGAGLDRLQFTGMVVEARPEVASNGQSLQLQVSVTSYEKQYDTPTEWKASTVVTCASGETIVLTGPSGPLRQVVALVTPAVVRRAATR